MFSVGSIGAIGRGSARSLDNLWRLAGFTPSFDFPFARNRSLVNAVTGQSLITYTQASSGTYVNSNRVITTAASNEPRFDHDPTTGESLGLLPEEQQTNLLLRSEDLDNASWVKAGSFITPNATTSPDESTTADKITESATTGLHYIYQLISVTAGQSYTLSNYMKVAERTQGILQLSAFNSAFPANCIAFFNLSTGAINSNGSGLTSSSIEAFPNGWYRCRVTATAQTTTTALVNSGGISNNTTSSYAGDGTSGIFTWGTDLKTGASLTSYIPTGASSVTRSASLADLVSSAIANNIRSFYVEFRSPAVGISGVVSLNDNTANNRAAVITSGTDPRLVVHSGGVEQANVNGGTVTAGARTRVAVRIDNNDFAISINGAAVVTDTSGTLPIVDRIMIGRTQAGEFLNSRIARFTGWNQLLSDATLRSLSSQ